MSTSTSLSSSVIAELRRIVHHAIGQHTTHVYPISSDEIMRVVEGHFGEIFTKRPPKERTVDVVLVMVGEICGSMNLHFPIEHVAELRASLEGLL